MSKRRDYRGYRDLLVYQKAFRLALEIFDESRDFPRQEQYSLTDQLRRSSRSIVVNIAEAWKKRRYPKAFISKLSDCSAEQAETTVWLDFCLHHKYLPADRHEYFQSAYDEIGAMLHGMMDKPEKFLQ